MTNCKDIINRLGRYTEKCIAEQLDPDFAAAVVEAKTVIDELLKAGKKMHTWIFLNSFDEQEAYDECGLTDEQNAMFGYGGQYILSSQPEEEADEVQKETDSD